MRSASRRAPVVKRFRAQSDRDEPALSPESDEPEGARGRCILTAFDLLSLSIGYTTMRPECNRRSVAEYGMADEVRENVESDGGDRGTGVRADRFVLIRIEGMHCHKCEQSIKKTLQRMPGVQEVEVDFASGQASVLFDPDLIAIGQLIEGVKEAGYKPAGFTESQAGI